MPEKTKKKPNKDTVTKKTVKKPSILNIPENRRISIQTYLKIRPLNKDNNLKAKKFTADGFFYIKSLLITTFKSEVFTKKEWSDKIKDLLSKNR